MNTIMSKPDNRLLQRVDPAVVCNQDLPLLLLLLLLLLLPLQLLHKRWRRFRWRRFIKILSAPRVHQLLLLL